VKLICHRVADAVLAGKAMMAPIKTEEGEGVNPAEAAAPAVTTQTKASAPEIFTPDDK
jgi:hypothetical protein